MNSANASGFGWRGPFRILRAHQYVKNVFILAPLFFTGKISQPQLLLRVLPVFAAFCALASAVYIFNDICDKEEDRAHPRKKDRPIPSGELSERAAWTLSGVLAGAAAALLGLFGGGETKTLYALFGAYAAVNIAYSLGLKHHAIVDVLVISSGFILRLFVGSTASSVPLSMWIIVITFLLAVFLALSKRRDDLLRSAAEGRNVRQSIDGYSLEFIDAGMVVMASVVIVSYIMYTVSADVMGKYHSDKLYLTTGFVVIGFLRYMQLTFVGQDTGSPTRILLKDRFLQAVILGWALFFAAVIYRP